MAELGITPEDLMMAQGGAKLAAEAIKYQKSGKFRFMAAKSAQERETRDNIRNYLTEICGKK